MKLFSVRNITIILLISLACCVIFSFWYASRINVYGDLKIFISELNEKPQNDYRVTGYGAFGREIELNYYNRYFKSEEYYCFNSLQIIVENDDSNNEFNLKILDDSDKILLDTALNPCQIHNISHLNRSDSEIKKYVFLSNKILSMRLILFICYFQIVVLLLASQYKKINRLGFYSLVISFIPLTASVAQFFYHGQFRIWTGFFILFFICLLIITIMLSCEKTLKKKNVILAVASVFFTLLLIELLLRITGFGLTDFEKRNKYYLSVEEQNNIKAYWVRPENKNYLMENDEFCFGRKSNSYGLSFDESLSSDKSNTKLIVSLGDSFTEGDGAHQDSTWVKFLERQFIEDSIMGFSFLNAGVCGSDPVYQYKLLEKSLLTFDPDIVIVCYGNEMSDMILRGGEERFENMSPAIKDKWWEPIYAVSHVFRLITRAFYADDKYFISKKEYSERTDKAISDLKKSLIDFKNLSEKNDFTLIVVFYPLKQETLNGNFDYNEELYKYAISQGIFSVDLLSYYQQRGINEDNYLQYYWPKDGHHNAKGYQMFARGVYPVVVKVINQPL